MNIEQSMMKMAIIVGIIFLSVIWCAVIFIETDVEKVNSLVRPVTLVAESKQGGITLQDAEGVIIVLGYNNMLSASISDSFDPGEVVFK